MIFIQAAVDFFIIVLVILDEVGGGYLLLYLNETGLRERSDPYLVTESRRS